MQVLGRLNTRIDPRGLLPWLYLLSLAAPS